MRVSRAARAPLYALVAVADGIGVNVDNTARLRPTVAPAALTDRGTR